MSSAKSVLPETISWANFVRARVTSIKNGGNVHLTNLRSICKLCEQSIGSENMDDFMDKYGLKKIKTGLVHGIFPSQNNIIIFTLVIIISMFHNFFLYWQFHKYIASHDNWLLLVTFYWFFYRDSVCS